MQERMRGYAANIQNRWVSLERSQQVRLIITVAVLVAMLIVAIVIVTRPTWVELKGGLDPVTLGTIQTALEEEGIVTKVSDATSTISVKEEDLDAARVTATGLPGIVSTGFTFDNALQASGMTATESVRDQAFAQLTKADMERMLMTFDGVQDAMVSISIPDDNAFAISDTVLPRAAITLRVANRMDDATGLAIANLMMASVKNLTLDNIEIMDQHANQIYSGSQKNASGASSQFDIIHQQEVLLDGRIRSFFMSLFDEVKVIPTLMFDFDQSTRSSTTYAPSAADGESSLPSSERLLKENATNQETAAEPGVVQNNMTTPTYEVGGNLSGTGSRTQTDRDFNNNVVQEDVVNAGGDLVLAESSLAVNCSRFKVYDETTISPEELNGLTWEQFKVQNAVSLPIPDTGDPNYNAANAPVGVVGMNLSEFSSSLAIATGIPAENISLIAYEVPVFNDRIVEPIQIGQIVMFIILALLILLLAFGLIRRAQPDEVVEVEPELSVEDLLVSTQLEEEKLTEAERLKEIELNAESEAKRQIEKFVVEKPEAVAQLLRNWLNDEWE